MAIVAGIVVGFVSGDWRLALSTAIGGTIFGHVAAIVAVITYVVLDNLWLRLGQQVNAAFVVFLSVGSAVALLVAVHGLNQGLGLDFSAVLDLAVSLYRIVLVAIFLLVLVPAIGEYFSNSRRRPPDN